MNKLNPSRFISEADIKDDDEASQEIILEEVEEDKESEENSEDNCKNVISQFTKIKKCSILKYGINLSTEKIKYGNCHTCDTNLMYPICADCLRECHKRKGHDTREIELPDFIVCGCGERMHHFKDSEKKKSKKYSSECPYSDWCEKSSLSTLYIVDEKCVCEFCYKMCGYEGRGRPLEKEREMLQVCECEYLNGTTTHADLKKIYHILEETIEKDHLILGIVPIKFLNLLFLGKSSYESVFQNFQEMIQNLNSLTGNNKLILKDNFSSTNFYLSLNVFIKVVIKAKGNPMRYYDKEISKKISFNLISNLLTHINYYDNKIFWHFLSCMLYIFRKVNIGLKTMSMSKFKLNDLENFSPFQRKNLFMFNNTIYPEASTQIEFFIKYLNNLLNEDMQLPEACDVIIQICCILKRLSVFYLFTDLEMISFCVTLDNMFQYLKHLKTYHKQIKLFNIITKMLNNFIYSYNDNTFCNFVLENKKEDLSIVKFVFDKNELGRLISRSIIRIMYYTIAIKKLNKLIPKDHRFCENIIEHGTKILNLMLTQRDNYFTNLTNMYLDIDLFSKTLEIPEDDEKFRKIKDEVKNIEKSFSSFFSFRLDNKEVIRAVNDSLEKIIMLAKAGETHPHLAKSNFFFSLMKTLYICNFEEIDEENIEEEDLVKNFLSNVFLFLHYFVEKNSGNALLICSFYSIHFILKLPDLYILEIFRLFLNCSDIISKKRGFISNIKFIVKSLYKYLLKFKNESKEKASKEAQDFFIDGVTILDQIIFFFLNIVIKLYLQTKLDFPFRCRHEVKKFILDFLNIFNFQDLMSHNACLILLLINRVFNSSAQHDREHLIKLIPIQKLVLTLEYTNIEIDYRTQILIFLKLFKCSMFLKKVEVSYSNQTRKDFSEIGMKTTMTDGGGKAKLRLKKNRKLHHIKNKENITEIEVNLLFSLNDEIIQNNNNYLNAIGQNGDNFIYIKNNPLISNYKFPTKYLSLYYFFLKNEDTKHSFKIAEASIDLYQKELKRFKDIFEKNTNYPNKMFRYLVKGIILPICPIIKLLFCYTTDCNGYNILMLYQTVMKMMYIKNYIIDMSNSFLSEKKFSQYEHFDLNGFMNKDLQEDNIQDYFNLKDKLKCSPYDFTYVWDIFEKHFLAYIKYPESLDLVNTYPTKELHFLTCSKISEDIELLDSYYYNLRKKGSSLKRKGLNRAKANNFILSTIESDKKLKSTKRSAYSGNQSFISSVSQHNMSNADLNINMKEEGQSKITKQKIEKIYQYYVNQKMHLDKENSSFIISLAELCPEYEINFRKMILTIILNLPGEDAESSIIARLIIYKLLIMTTEEVQNDISSLIGKKEKDDIGFISNLCNLLYDGIIKFFIDDFNIDFVNFRGVHIDIFSSIKILKYLCEEHNNYFQEIILCRLDYAFTKFSECKMTSTASNKANSENSKQLSQTSSQNDSEETMSFFNFLINVLDKILIVTQKVHNKRHISFLFDIVYSIIELLVEIIQGNKKEILSKAKEDETKNNMSLFTMQNFVSTVSDILLDDSLLEGHAFRTRLLLISFFIAILEEKTNEEIQKIIMKFLSINKVMSSISFTMKNYFYKITKDDPDYKNYYSNYTEKQINHRDFIFDNTVYSFFKEHYFHSEVSKEKEFELANNYYKYIKKLSINGKSPEAEELVEQINNLNEKEAKKKFAIFNKKIIKSNKIVPINLINEKEKSISVTFIEHYYIVKFFELITQVVEIRLPHEHRNVNVIFTLPCEMIHLTQMTKEEFIHEVDRTSENSKKFELIRSISLFQLEIEYFKNTNVSCFSKFILGIDFIYVQYLMYIYALIFLIFMLFTLEGYKGIEPIKEEDEGRRRLLRFLVHTPSKILNSINSSIDSWGNIYNYICYVFCGLNAILIFSWIAVKMPLYYMLDKFKYIEENKMKESQLTFWNKASIMVFDSIIGRDYINTLIYMFIVSTIGTILIRGEIVYAFLLLTIVNLNKTLKGIAISIKLRGPELGASFLLLIFIVYFYSNLGFFYLNDNFKADIENDIPDNYCLCLSFCFMTNFDAGIRARGGAADQMVRISFGRNRTLYYSRIVYDVSYFLICIIIMIDLVFGIILGTFSDMREKERKYDNDKINNCFICHINRETVEKKKEDFQSHRDKKHYLWNYVNYMIFLKFSEPHELNACNSFVRHNLVSKNICFLPSCLDNFDEDEIEEEKEEEMIGEESEESSSDSYTFEEEEEYDEDDDEEVGNETSISKVE